MRRLRERFRNELVVIGVHSAKFPSEELTANLREAVMRHGIEHPVVNDAGFGVWHSFAVRAWPTLVLVDPEGGYTGAYSGEIEAGQFSATVENLIQEFDREGLIDRAPLDFQKEAAPSRPLAYPSKLLPVDSARLFVSDTAHHRILELALPSALIEGTPAHLLRVFGSGEEGMADGPAGEAAFHNPHGLAVIGKTLYVADTDNHAVRAIDLETAEVRTVAGTGMLGRGRRMASENPREMPLRSPWALLPLETHLLIAMAGSHQIWLLLDNGRLGVFAGNGREALVDGPREQSSFNQPSDLTLGYGHVFVADSEASAVRAITLEEETVRVITLVGQGLFEWGDIDGVGPKVRLQHPTGVAFADGAVWIADSYNHKIKRLDPTNGKVESVIGSGAAGHADGPFAEARLFEPEGVAPLDGHLLIADTNNHQIRVADLAAQRLWTLDIEGL